MEYLQLMFMKQTDFNFKVPYMSSNSIGYNVIKGAKNEPNPCDKYFNKTTGTRAKLQ